MSKIQAGFLVFIFVAVLVALFMHASSDPVQSEDPRFNIDDYTILVGDFDECYMFAQHKVSGEYIWIDQSKHERLVYPVDVDDNLHIWVAFFEMRNDNCVPTGEISDEPTVTPAETLSCGPWNPDCINPTETLNYDSECNPWDWNAICETRTPPFTLPPPHPNTPFPITNTPNYPPGV